MPANAVPRGYGLKLDRMMLLRLYPQLRDLAPETWQAALARARDTSFDTLEWVGITGGAAFVAWLLDAETVLPATEPGFRSFVVQFVVALPLLAAVVGPLYLRRTRRGLERERARVQSRAGGASALPGRKEA